MNISEATREAVKKGCRIGRPFGDGSKRIIIRPTNGSNCCIAYSFDGVAYRCWAPTAEDLIAEDWETTEG